MDFGRGAGGGRIGANPQNEMLVDRERIKIALLLAREIPVGIKPVRIAGGEHQFLRAIGVRQLAFRFQPLDRRGRTQGIPLTRPADRNGGRVVILQEDRQDARRLGEILAGGRGDGGSFGQRRGGW